jgi:G3E family GTPase
MRYTEPEFLPWDGRRVPLTLLGGYLGAGKTTLLNELLARADRPIAVLVNDVGSVNIDAALVKRRNNDTIEFTDGCVCCGLSDGLGAAFDRLRARDVPPEHVVLELSGLAEPARVAPWGRSAGFVLDGIVVVVDGEQFIEQLNRDVVGQAVTTQVRSADLLIVSKVDLIDDVDLRTVTDRLAALAPDVPVITSTTASAAVLELGRRDVERAIPPSTLFDAHRIDVVPFPLLVDAAALESWLTGLAPDVVRAKGVVELAAGGQYLVQVVGRRRIVEPVPDPERTEATDLVVISVPGDKPVQW